MDFAAALAKLEKTASAAANSSRNGAEGADRRRRSEEYHNGHTPHREPQRQRRRFDHPRHGHSDPFNGLIRFGYNIRPQAKADDIPSGSGRPRHICLLLLCIDSVPYIDIWRAWARHDDDGTALPIVSVAIHAKNPRPLSMDEDLKKHLLVRPPRLGRGNAYGDLEYFTLNPNWGSIQLTKAMLELLRQGLQIGLDSDQTDERFASRRFILSPRDQAPETIPPADHFIFISESCVPVRTLKECTAAIAGPDVDCGKFDAEVKTDDSESRIADYRPQDTAKSWVCARNRNSPGVPRNKYERDQFQNIDSMVPQFCRWKADQWILLSRQHAAAVIRLDAHMRPGDQLINLFSKIPASDEMYFPTTLAVLGYLKEGEAASPSVLMQRVTYVDWSEGMRNPASYERGMRDFRRIAKVARGQGCLFARKFLLNAPGRNDTTGRIGEDEWLVALRELAEEENVSANNAEERIK